jgi:hypothetical protein
MAEPASRESDLSDFGYPERTHRASSRSTATYSTTQNLFAPSVRFHQVPGDLPGALAVCTEGLSLDSNDPGAPGLFHKPVVYRKAGQPAEAESCWRRILMLNRPEQCCSVDQGIYVCLTRRNPV